MVVRPAKRIRGRLCMPGDKSISHRAAMIAALAEGSARIRNYSNSEDCAATVRGLQQLGVRIQRAESEIVVKGVGLHGFDSPAQPLDCGNSGTTMRLLAGILAGQNFTSTLTGDESLRSRPMQRIIEPLQMMGAKIVSRDARPPLIIEGSESLRPVTYELRLASAQVKSSILLAGLSANGRTTVIENEPTRDHTERMLNFFGSTVETGHAQREGEQFVALNGPANLQGRDVSIPGDVSSAAYFVAAAGLLGGSSLEIHSVGLNPTRVEFLRQLQSMRFIVATTEETIETNEPRGTIRARGAERRHLENSASRTRVDGVLIPRLIDELPLLAIVGTQINGGIEIRDAAELRVKESDRIATTIENLRAMGADVLEFDDGLRVNGPTHLRGASVDPHGDHRIAMAFAIAALLADGETEIKDSDCVAVSFPEFFELLNSVVEY
jgi:3-phosphoshikimate 1-carboxyvinyltransferase